MNYHVFHDSFTGDIEHSGIFDLFPKISYRKQVRRFWQSWRHLSKQGRQKVPRPRPVLPSLLRPICQACVNSQLSPTPPTPPRGREKKNVTKMNFLSCNDHSSKWIINDCYIFSLTFEFEYFFSCGLLSLQHNTLVLCYTHSLSPHDALLISG